MASENAPSHSDVTSKDIETVAAATMLGSALDTLVYISADVATGGLLTAAGLVVGVITVLNEKEKR